MATRIPMDPNCAAAYAYNAGAGYIPTEGARPVLPHLDSIPSTEALPSSPSLESMPNANLPSVGASPSLPALPSSSSLPAQPSLVELAITKALKNRCIFFGGGCDQQFDFLEDGYPTTFQYNQMEYKCVTAAFEAQKFTAQPDLMKEFSNKDSLEAWSLSRNNEDSEDDFFDFIKRENDIMKGIQKAKFEQNPHLARLLLLTVDAYLVCHTKFVNDGNKWNDESNGKGKNLSGCILMSVRKQLGGRGVQQKPANFNELLYELKQPKS